MVPGSQWGHPGSPRPLHRLPHHPSRARLRPRPGRTLTWRTWCQCWCGSAANGTRPWTSLTGPGCCSPGLADRRRYTSRLGLGITVRSLVPRWVKKSDSPSQKRKSPTGEAYFGSSFYVVKIYSKPLSETQDWGSGSIEEDKRVWRYSTESFSPAAMTVLTSYFYLFTHKIWLSGTKTLRCYKLMIYLYWSGEGIC